MCTGLRKPLCSLSVYIWLLYISVGIKRKANVMCWITRPTPRCTWNMLLFSATDIQLHHQIARNLPRREREKPGDFKRSDARLASLFFSEPVRLIAQNEPKPRHHYTDHKFSFHSDSTRALDCELSFFQTILSIQSYFLIFDARLHHQQICNLHGASSLLWTLLILINNAALMSESREFCNSKISIIVSFIFVSRTNIP